MSEEDIVLNVDTNSARSKESVEPVHISEENTMDRKAGGDLSHELKEKGVPGKPAHKKARKESAIPLFLRDSSDGNKGNGQDEKDATEE